MKKLCLLLLLLTLYIVTFGQQKRNSILYKKLNAMFVEDQKWRVEAGKLYKHEKSDYTEATINKNWHISDARNEVQIKRIFAKYGYPGYSLVGESGSSKFWAIVQHCDGDVAFQQKVLLRMKKEVALKNANGENYAFLQDRVLTNLGKKQIYGTQAHRNPKTQKIETFDLADPANVDVRRKSVGLDPLQQYLDRMNQHQ